jgi:hypothetical protein
MMEGLGIGKLPISVMAAALLANIGAANAQQASDPRVADLVQAGKVRVGLFSTQYTKDPASGELMGVRAEIARALAAQIGVPAVLLEHGAPPDVVQCLEAGACDVVFLPRDERSAGVGDFSPPYLQSEYTMLVPAGSPIRSVADADKSGLRIAAVRNHSSTMTLTGAIRQAEVILGENELAAFELLHAGARRRLRVDPPVPAPCFKKSRRFARAGRLLRRQSQPGGRSERPPRTALPCEQICRGGQSLRSGAESHRPRRHIRVSGAASGRSGLDQLHGVRRCRDDGPLAMKSLDSSFFARRAKMV